MYNDYDTGLILRPSYWASVSGGKDSFFMLNYILHNLDKYPLNGVVHFELEIDYPFIHDAIDYMESECKKHNITFFKIKPRHTWEELYNKYGFPTKKVRWCNRDYKLDAKNQLEEFLNSLGYYSVTYIGYCADEEKRFSGRRYKNVREIYPLVEAGIQEDSILEWAKTQPIYNDFYTINRRCGCMYCPMSSMIEKAYLLKYYPDKYDYMMKKAKDTEIALKEKYGYAVSVWDAKAEYDTDYIDNVIRTKWLRKLDKKENDTGSNFSLF